MDPTTPVNGTAPGVLQVTDAFAGWNGGVLFVIVIDVCVFAIASFFFLILRRYALTHAQPEMQLSDTSGLLDMERMSFFQQVIHRTFRRFNTMQADKDPGWLSWIWGTVTMPGEETLERCGRDGYLYLKMQRLCMMVLFLSTLVALPVLLPLYVDGEADISGFSKWTGKNLERGSVYLWVPAGFTLFLTLLLLAVIFLLFKSIRKHSQIEKKRIGVDPRYFTIKINHFPRHVFAEDVLEDYFEYLFPGHVLQVYIVLDLGPLEKLWHRARKTKMKVYHYQAQIIEDKMEGRVYRPKMVPNFCGLRCCCGEEVDAVEYYQNKARELEEEFHRMTRSAKVKKSTGVAFVTFRTFEACNTFLKRFKKGDYEDEGDMALAPRRTASGRIVTQAVAREQAALRSSPTVAEEEHSSFDTVRMLLEEEDEDDFDGPAFDTIPILATADMEENGESEPNVRRITPQRFRECRSIADPDRWYVTRAPNVQNIQWHNLSAGTMKMIFSLIVVNGLLCFVLFFFTTPVAMLGELQSWDAGHDAIDAFEQWLSSKSVLGSILVGYLPSLILLGITAILPHVIYFTTLYLEVHHTGSSQHRAGMFKVFFYQVIAILVLPTMTITSVRGFLEASLEDLEEIVETGGLFPNGMFFVKYVIQAAMLGGAVDLFRGPEILIEKWKKWNAETLHELEEAEKVPPFKFGYEYSYTMLVLTITLFYSTIVPIILPAGLIFISIKHFIDKYNLVYVYAKSPPSANYMTKVVVLFMLIALNLYLVAMMSFFYFSKEVVGPTALVLTAFIATNVVGFVLFFGYFRYVKGKDYSELQAEAVDAGEFVNAYLHPALKNQDDAFMQDDDIDDRPLQSVVGYGDHMIE